MYDSRTGIVRI